jgi:hypothetical protein
VARARIVRTGKYDASSVRGLKGLYSTDVNGKPMTALKVSEGAYRYAMPGMGM